MSYGIEARRKSAQTIVWFGGALCLWDTLSDSTLAWFGGIIGFGLFVTGAVMLVSVSIINGTSVLVRLISLGTEPKWHGEILYTDGGMHKVRYAFDGNGRPWFVASDVCAAVGKEVPNKRDRKCGGVPLCVHGGLVAFTEDEVQSYLKSLAVRNHDATRLLVIIRNNVLRRLEKWTDCHATGTERSE